MSNEKKINTVVIGSGPGGYPCGIRLGQLGVDTVVLEKENAGGVCLNVGCIPSKALIHAAKTYEKMTKSADMGITVSGAPKVDMAKMQEWKSGIVKKLTGGVKSLLKANKTQFAQGTAKLLSKGPDGHRVEVTSKEGKTIWNAKNVVVATGSRPIEIPGFKPDGKLVLDSTGALALDKVPGKMVVIGGGYIGLELGTVFAKLGTKVTVVEAQDSILSVMDPDCTKVIERKLKKMGVEIMVKTKADSWKAKGKGAVLTVEKGGKKVEVETDAILVSVGRRPNSENLGLESVGVKVERGFVKIDKHLKTNVPGIYAIGDVAGGMLLAHKATKEGEVVAEIIAGHKAAVDWRSMPAVVFTDPEMASAGLTEKEAKEAGILTKVGKFPFAALGRALSVNDTDGFVKVIADKSNDEVVGLHIVGNGACDLISEGSLAIEMGAVLHDLMLTVHPHPTLSESIMEAAAAALGEAVHVINR